MSTTIPGKKNLIKEQLVLISSNAIARGKQNREIIKMKR
jgi:hypothetical protein